MKRGIAFLIVVLLALPACGDNRDDLIAELQQLQSSAQAVRGNPRAAEIGGELDSMDAAIAAAVAAAQALPPDFVPDPDYLSTVTPDSIITGAGDVLPRQPIDFTTDQDGEWHDAATWGGIVPPPGANCQVLHDVTFGVQDPAGYGYIEVLEGASLTHQPGAEHLFQTLVFFRASHLAGSAASPVPLDNRVRLIFRDVPLPVGDSHEMSNGLLYFDSTVRLYGEAPVSWLTADEGIEPGEVIGNLALNDAPLGWDVGHRIFVGATKQVGHTSPGTRNYTNVGSNELLSWPDGVAAIDHPEINGVDAAGTPYRITAGLANLERGIVVTSENPDGVRGHVMATGRTSVLTDGVAYARSGRTQMGSIFSGSNQAGRYGGMHLHHCIGPVDSNLQEDGRTWQGIQRNCVAYFDPDTNPTRWGFTVHGCSFHWLDNCVAVGAGGSCFNTENGQEWACRFSNNYAADSLAFRELVRGGVVNVSGSGVDTGGDGSGFWLRSCGHELYGNLVQGVRQSAYNFNGYYDFSSVATLPAQPGDRNDTWVLNADHDGDQPVPDFHDNVASSCGVGLWQTWSQAQYTGATTAKFRRQVIRDLQVGNCATVVECWHEAAWDFIRVDGKVSDPSVFLGELFQPEEPRRSSYGFSFLASIYENSAHRLIDCSIDNAAVGILTPQRMTGPAVSQHPFTAAVPPGVDPQLFYAPVNNEDFLVYGTDSRCYYPIYSRKTHVSYPDRVVVVQNCQLIHDPQSAHPNMSAKGDWHDLETKEVWLNPGSQGSITVNGQAIE